MNPFLIIQGLLSSVPAAIAAWEAIAPHLSAHLSIPDDDRDKVLAAVQEGHAAVDLWHRILASPNPAGAVLQAVIETSPATPAVNK